MRRTRFSIAVIVLLILGQCLVAVHAVEFGTGTHEHEDVVCSVALPEEDYDAVLLPYSENILLVNGSRSCSISISQSCVSSFLYRWPPPTGPPLKA